MKNLNNTLNEITIAFKELNEILFENKLPEPVLVIQSRKAGMRNSMGWMTVGETWTDRETGQKFTEITICSETLNEKLNVVLEVLVHEMVHLKNKCNGIDDCSSSQYHNKNFKEAAEKALLICECRDEKYGYGFTRASDKLIEIFNCLSIDESAFSLASDEKVSVSKDYFMFNYKCDNCGITFKTKANLGEDTICLDCGGKINKY